MSASTENVSGADDITKSTVRLTDDEENKTWKEKSKGTLKKIKSALRETTVEPCLFIYMLCTAVSSLAVQNMHLEKSCRVNFQFGEEICDRIAQRDTEGIEDYLNQVHTMVAKLTAWKLPLQTFIPALMALFVGAWSDKYKKRKICILFPMIGEILACVGLLLATYFFYELSLIETVLIETLPAALTGSYIIIFMGMYSFMTDRTTIENRTFRLGIVTICVTLGTPTGTALSGILLRALGYYGVFSLTLSLYLVAFIYGLIRLEDIKPNEEEKTQKERVTQNQCSKTIKTVLGLVANTVKVALKSRPFSGRTKILSVLLLYIIMVGPLYGDAQVAYLYAIRRFNFTEVEYSIYGTINIVLGLIGTLFCIAVLSKMFHVHDTVIGGLAGVSRIAASFVFAFAPNRRWFYSAPLFNIFSHTGLTAIRSIATKSVPTEEVAMLSSLMGLMEAIAPSIYAPASGFIYAATIETFPGAFYMFDATLTVVALALFVVIYVLEKRKEKLIASNEREEYATTNNDISELYI